MNTLPKSITFCVLALVSLGLQRRVLAEEPLEKIGKVVRDCETGLTSLVGVATFRCEAENRRARSSGSKTSFSGKMHVHFDRGKYHIRIEYKDGIPYDELYIIFDGERSFEVAFSSRDSGIGCSGDIHQDIRDSLTMNGFGSTAPARLWRMIIDADAISKRRDAGELRVMPVKVLPGNGLTFGYYKNASGLKVEYDLLSAQSYLPTARRVFNAGSKQPSSVYEISWEEIGGNLYATKGTESNNYSPQGVPERSFSIKYESFVPNAEVDPRLFSLDLLGIPLGTRFPPIASWRIHRLRQFHHGISPRQSDHEVSATTFPP